MRDGIHLATPDVKRVGRRLANLVVRKEYGQSENPRGPKLERIRHDPITQKIYFRFSDLTGGFDTSARIAGFTLRTAAASEIAAIYRSAVDPSDTGTIVLSYQGKLPDGTKLVYGWGANP